MTNRITQVNKKDLNDILATRAKAAELAKVAEQAMKDARMAELEFKVQIQQFYIEKNLHMNCRVNVDTGEITWPEETVEVPEAPAPKKEAYFQGTGENVDKKAVFFQGTEEPVAVKKNNRRTKKEEVVDAEFTEEKSK